MLPGRLGRSGVQLIECGESACVFILCSCEGMRDSEPCAGNTSVVGHHISVHGRVLVGLCLWRTAEEVGLAFPLVLFLSLFVP